MAHDDRPSERYRNRGMFGYEGEGYMAPAEDRDRHERGEGRYRNEEFRTGFSGGYGGGQYHDDRDMPGGYRDLESGADRGWNIGRDTDRGPRGAQRPSFRGRGPKNYQRSDERIHEDVCERLAMDHDVDASEIEVTVKDAVVTLEGTVNERNAKRIAEDIAESVRGVKDVQNSLRVSR
jgi:hypothetical protein